MTKYILAAVLTLNLALGQAAVVGARTVDTGVEAKVFSEATFNIGATGTEVRKLQDFLKDQKVFPAEVSSTGYYGNITAEAVSRLVAKYENHPDFVGVRALGIPAIVGRAYSLFGTPAAILQPIPLAQRNVTASALSPEMMESLRAQMNTLRLMLVNLIARPFGGDAELKVKVEAEIDKDKSRGIRKECKGDLNQDGKIDNEDVAIFKYLFNLKVSNSVGQRADFDDNGVIDQSDLAALLSVYSNPNLARCAIG